MALQRSLRRDGIDHLRRFTFGNGRFGCAVCPCGENAAPAGEPVTRMVDSSANACACNASVTAPANAYCKNVRCL